MTPVGRCAALLAVALVAALLAAGCTGTATGSAKTPGAPSATTQSAASGRTATFTDLPVTVTTSADLTTVTYHWRPGDTQIVISTYSHGGWDANHPMEPVTIRRSTDASAPDAVYTILGHHEVYLDLTAFTDAGTATTLRVDLIDLTLN